MFTKFRQRLESEKGFTLIELLVVILIIGILAAIALPAFLGQRAKGQDGEAKSNARNLVSQVESCYAQSQDYGDCNTIAELGSTGLPLTDAAPAASSGNVAVTTANENDYVIRAESKSGNRFEITHATTGVNTRGCTSTGAGNGGCDDGSW